MQWCLKGHNVQTFEGSLDYVKDLMCKSLVREKPGIKGGIGCEDGMVAWEDWEICDHVGLIVHVEMSMQGPNRDEESAGVGGACNS